MWSKWEKFTPDGKRSWTTRNSTHLYSSLREKNLSKRRTAVYTICAVHNLSAHRKKSWKAFFYLNTSCNKSSVLSSFHKERDTKYRSCCGVVCNLLLLPTKFIAAVCFERGFLHFKVCILPLAHCFLYHVIQASKGLTGINSEPWLSVSHEKGKKCCRSCCGVVCSLLLLPTKTVLITCVLWKQFLALFEWGFAFFSSSTFLFFLYHGLLQASKGLLSSSSSLHDGLSVGPVSFFSVLLWWFVDEGFMDMWDDSTACNGALNQCVQLFISSNCKLQMAGCDAFHLQIFAGISCKF